MMATTTENRHLHEQFAELVCADEAWLRAEFDAIVAANFAPIIPPPSRLGSRPASPWPGRPPWAAVGVAEAAAARWDRFAPGRRWSRQRSPPQPRPPPGGEIGSVHADSGTVKGR